MRLLVTGGAGYIGSITTAHLLAAGHRVVVLDDLSTGFRDAVPEAATFRPGRVHDIRPGDLDGIDAVAHLAGRIAAGESMVRPELHWHVNTSGTLALLEAMRVAGTPRLVFSSTAAVYGDPVEIPVTETALPAPTSVYGATKLAADHAIASYAAAHGLAATSLRYFNVCGAYGRLGERHDPETHLIPIALQVAAGRRTGLDLYGDDYPTRDGTCVRDYVHVADLAAAHVLALDAQHPSRHEVFNLGNGAGFSNREVIDAVRTVTGHPVPVTVRPRRSGDPHTLVASSAKAQTVLGWRPHHTQLIDIVADAWRFARDR